MVSVERQLDRSKIGVISRLLPGNLSLSEQLRGLETLPPRPVRHSLSLGYQAAMKFMRVLDVELNNLGFQRTPPRRSASEYS